MLCSARKRAEKKIVLCFPNMKPSLMFLFDVEKACQIYTPLCLDLLVFFFLLSVFWCHFQTTQFLLFIPTALRLVPPMITAAPAIVVEPTICWKVSGMSAISITAVATTPTAQALPLLFNFSFSISKVAFNSLYASLYANKMLFVSASSFFATLARLFT